MSTQKACFIILILIFNIESPLGNCFDKTFCNIWEHKLMHGYNIEGEIEFVEKFKYQEEIFCVTFLCMLILVLKQSWKQ